MTHLNTSHCLCQQIPNNEELNKIISNDMEENNLSQLNCIFLSLLKANSSIKNDYSINPMVHGIKTTLLKMNASANSPEMRFYAGAYESCNFYKIDDGTRIVSISYHILIDPEKKNLRISTELNSLVLSKYGQTDQKK